MIGSSPAFLRMRNAARMVAATEVGVLLLGEAGSGRTTLARDIHAHGPRRHGPFVVLPCVGAPLLALEEAIAASADGTLYFHEVAELGAELQARLLYLLSEASHGAGAVPRVIAGSASDLDGLAARGDFRRDLALRLAVIPIEVPPLRDRILDIPDLIEAFLTAAAQRHAVPVPRLSAGAERRFRRYSWPGNLSELRNLCERLAVLYPGVQIGPGELPAGMLRDAPAHGEAGDFVLPPHGIDLNAVEAELMRQALALAGGNKTRAARLLGLSRDTFLYRIQKHLISA